MAMKSQKWFASRNKITGVAYGIILGELASINMVRQFMDLCIDICGLIGPKECLEFADYSFDEHFKKPIPSFPPRAVLYDYIIGRVSKGKLKSKIKFNTRVVNTIYKNDKFEVSYQDKVNDKVLKDNFDFVVVSTGHFSVPYIPEYEGMNSFPGRIMHSHDFRDAEEFRNKNVIVLGSSYSAEDVALQCNKYGAKSVTIGYRHNPMGFKWPKGMKEVHYLDRLEEKKQFLKMVQNKKQML